MRIFFSIFAFAVCFSLQAQNFQFVKPDMNHLNKLSAAFDHEKSGFTQLMGYLYLTEYYPSISEKDSVAHCNADPQRICHFTQRFEGDIEYSFTEEEESNYSETLVFPKTDLEKVKSLVETIFFSQQNTWTTETRYEADGGPGCYVEIIEDRDRTVIKNGCGC